MMGLLVTKDDSRPAGKPGECFYCRKKIDEPHTWECVIPEKVVRVKTTFEYMIRVPRSWDAHNVEFHRNESSSCADNILQDLEAYANSEGCLCSSQVTEYISEAPNYTFKEKESDNDD